MAWSRLAALGVLLVPAAWVACSSFEASDDGAPDAGADASTTPPLDGGGGDSAEVDAAAGPPETSFTDLKNWQAYTLKDTPSTALLMGGVYDSARGGLYFAAGHGFMVKYDTTADFAADTSWQTLDVTTLPGAPRLFNTGVVGSDGLLYFPAGFNSVDVLHQVSARFDPSRDFKDVTAWQTFSTTELTDGGYAPFGGAFATDASVTFLPYDRTVSGDGDAATVKHAPPATFSFGANSAFTDRATWVPNTSLLSATSQQLTGAAVVGSYVYAGSATASEVMRLGTALAAPAERYSTLGILPKGSAGVGSFGTITDGRYVYFAPCYTLAAAYSGQLVRYDTTRNWAEDASFEVFDLSSLDVTLLGFTGGTFDGRFIYLVGLANEKVVRFDTTKALSDHDAYEIFDLAAIKKQPLSLGRDGASFDGQYVYISPSYSSEVFRFKAKTAHAAWPNQASNF